MAQKSLTIRYDYDDAGNRTSCKVITMPSFSPSPPAAPDSTETEPEPNLMSLESLRSLELPDEKALDSIETEPLPTEYYIEKIAQVEMKIFPNPTTEKITLEISAWEALQTGIFTLLSPTGQLLQERVVHSATTAISLAGLPKGTYILKVHINGKTEDWKIIKN